MKLPIPIVVTVLCAHYRINKNTGSSTFVKRTPLEAFVRPGSGSALTAGAAGGAWHRGYPRLSDGAAWERAGRAEGSTPLTHTTDSQGCAASSC